MIVDEVSSSDALLIRISRIGKGPHAGESKQYRCTREPGVGNHAVCFGEQIRDLFFVDRDSVRVAFVAYVGGPNQIVSIPGDDEEWPLIACGFSVERGCRRAGEWSNHEVAAFRATNHPLNTKTVDQPINPGARSVDSDGRNCGARLLCLQIRERDTAYGFSLNNHALYASISVNDRARFLSCQRVFQHQTFGKLDLRIVIKRCTAQAVGVKPRYSVQRFFPGK